MREKIIYGRRLHGYLCEYTHSVNSKILNYINISGGQCFIFLTHLGSLGPRHWCGVHKPLEPKLLQLKETTARQLKNRSYKFGPSSSTGTAFAALFHGSKDGMKGTRELLS